MQDQKIFLPSPNFEIRSETKSSTPVSNLVIKQVKCLASHKLLSSDNLVTKGGNHTFHRKQNREVKCVFNANHNIELKNPWCETYDRKCNIVDDIYRQKRENEKCELDGCNFQAHLSVVSKHIQEQHSCGLYDKIRKLNTPEEIAKWREERKKCYPTRANVELRQKAQEERNKRGEKLTHRKGRFGKRRDRETVRNEKVKKKEQSGQQMPNGQQKITQNRLKKQKRSNFKKLKVKKVEDEVKNIRLKQEIDIYDKEENFSEDDEENTLKILRFEGTKNITDYKKLSAREKAQNALTSLLEIYGSDVSENEEGCINDSKFSVEGNVKYYSSISVDLKNSGMNSNNKCESISLEDIRKISYKDKNNSIKFFKLSDSESDMPEEIPIIKDEIISNANTSKEKPNLIKKQIKKSLPSYSKLKYRRPNTLLERLLEPDIRHERNILLQCVRFAVENNFFNIGGSSRSEIS